MPLEVDAAGVMPARQEAQLLSQPLDHFLQVDKASAHFTIEQKLVVWP